MNAEPARATPAPTRGGPPRRAIVWLTTGLTGATAGLLVSLAVRSLPALHGPFRLTWWMLACGFALADIFVVHLHFRRDAYTQVLDELPLIAGLILGVPWAVVAARVAGAAVALAIHRRQPPIKLLYNLALAALCTTVAVIVYRACLGTSAPFSAVGLAAGMAATLSQAVIACIWIVAVMAITEGPEQLRRLPRLLGFVIPATVFDTAVGLAGLRFLEQDPAAAVLLIVPVAALLIAYRAYIRERQRHDHLRLLYESSHAFHHAHGFDATVTTLLRRAREMLRADIAQLTLLPADSEGMALRFCLGPGDIAELVEEKWTPDNVATEVAASGSRLVPRGRAGGGLTARMAAEGMRDAVAVTIGSEGGVYGALLVANRRGDVATFGGDDLALLEAFAGQVGVSINNGRLEAELQQLAFHDSLTGLGNRALLSMRLESALRRRRAAGAGPAVLIIDLDDFKTVNDSLGHSTGDRLLVAVADRLRGVLRPSDTIARLGGDEFAVVLEEIDDPATATDVADRLVEAMRETFVLDGTLMRIHASTGIVIATSEDESSDVLLSRADVAMYRAKARGKGCWELFEPTMQAAVQERHRLKLYLQRAVDRGSLFVQYQPIVDLEREEMVGVEALVRWEHPTRGLISPDEFIPLAEESGLIVQLGREVLEQACREAAAWQRILPEFAISVNVSARQLQEPGFAGEVSQLLRRSGLSPARLILEITERAMVSDEDTTREALARLRDLPVDILKIAKPFVDGLGEGEQDRAFVTAIVRMAQTLQLDMIAEGIERPEQLELLQGLRCGLGQGYLLGRPMSSGGITELLVMGRSHRRPVSVVSSAG